MAEQDDNNQNMGMNDGSENLEAAEPEHVAAAEPVVTENQDNLSVPEENGKMEFILDIPLEITVELGRTKMVINDLLKLSQGSVIELTKVAGETLEILANQKLIARGEAVVVNEKFGVRLTEVISPMERIKGLK